MITAAHGKASLAGLMYVKVNALRVVRHRRNLSKPVILRATDSGVQNSWRNFVTSGSDAFHTCSKEFFRVHKKGLDVLRHPGLWL
jgi:hypothetical protein